ncbi:MAG: M48 family metallopeptidase [Candidatus Omnitrophota bacterium]|nr:M48 family metallopeptidase [Candidatus Omnitrophota bacterium]
MKTPLSTLLFLTFITGCATVYNPATNKQEFVFIDTKAEVSLGKIVNSNIARDYKISEDPAFNQRVKSIGKKITLVCDRRDLEYKFSVVEDKELNAFSLPGGFVYVNTGLLNKANDDELAGVMAHEIGHIVARHSVKQLQLALGLNIVMAVAFNKSSAADLSSAVNVVYNLISLGYSRGDERQADKLGVIYTHKAKYNPYGMVTFFDKLKQEEKDNGVGNIPVFLRSHPTIEERIKNIKTEIKLQETLKPKAIETVNNPSVADLSWGSSDNQANSNTSLAITRKMCPTCKRVFSGKDNFCPDDGYRLVF